MLQKKDILFLHNEIAKKYGGDTGVRDAGLFELLSEAPYQTFGDVELFPTIFDKAARFLTGFVSHQALLDGNKRIGVATSLIFLKKNGYELCCTEKELYDLVMNIASHSNIPFEKVSSFLKEKSVKAPKLNTNDSLQWIIEKYDSVLADLAKGVGEELILE